MCLQIQSSSSSLACRNEAEVTAESGSSDPPFRRSTRSALIPFCYRHIGTSPCLAPDHLTALLPLWQDSCSRALPNISAVLHEWWKTKAKQNILGQLKLLSTVRIKEFVLKSPVSLTDSQPPSFDHFEWSEQEECSVKWEISHSAQVSQSHNISLISGSVCNAEVRQDSLLPSPAKTLILGNVSFSVSRSLLRALCSTAVPISEERIPVEYYWALIHVWIILYSNLFLEWTFSSLDLFPSLCLIPDLLWTKGRIIIFCSPTFC